MTLFLLSVLAGSGLEQIRSLEVIVHKHNCFLVLISCLMLWKAQIKGGHCPEVLTIKTAKTTVVFS